MYVLYTGGTFGTVASVPDNPASPRRSGTTDDLEPHLPDASALNIEYTLAALYEADGKALLPPLDSSNVTSEHWRCMAAAIGRVYDDYDGFVVLHGTDTMAYTASALSFMLENLSKPVVVTGSQLAISDTRTDATTNFLNALSLAGHRARDLPLIPEVVICFGDVILRGNRARKMSTTSWHGFDSPNCAHLGRIGESILIEQDHLRPVPVEAAGFYTRLDLDPKVVDIGLFPGVQARQLGALLDAEFVNGAILRTFGAGNAPTDQGLLDVIENAVDSGTVVVNVTHCPQGIVEEGLYETSNALLQRGVTSGSDMTPEAALTKLMHLLANEPTADVASQMQVDQRGEQSVSLFDVRFGPADADAGENGSPVRLAARPGGRFRPGHLQRAVLRLHGVKLTGPNPGAPYTLSAFLNHRNADRGTPSTDPRFAAHFWLAAGDEPAEVMGDVTSTARRVLEAGRSVALTLVCDRADGHLAVGAASVSLST